MTIRYRDLVAAFHWAETKAPGNSLPRNAAAAASAGFVAMQRAARAKGLACDASDPAEEIAAQMFAMILESNGVDWRNLAVPA